MWSRVYLAGSITLLSNHPFVIGTRLRALSRDASWLRRWCKIRHLFWNYKRFKTQVNCLNFNNVGDVGGDVKSQRKNVGDVGDVNVGGLQIILTIICYHLIILYLTRHIKVSDVIEFSVNDSCKGVAYRLCKLAIVLAQVAFWCQLTAPFSSRYLFE